MGMGIWKFTPDSWKDVREAPTLPRNRGRDAAK